MGSASNVAHYNLLCGGVLTNVLKTAISLSRCKAAGSGAASTAMAVPLFLKIKKLKKLN